MARAQRRILLTGPISELHRYADAARAAGWDPRPFPLLEIRELGVDLAAHVERLPHWICVTSRNALAALERARSTLVTVPCATVGRTSAGLLEDLGFRVEIEGASSAGDLAERLAPRLLPRARVLWPRGSRAQDLALLLRKAGAEVDDPVVYETIERPPSGHVPAAEAVFFASPSAVEAFLRLERAPGSESVAIGIGPTTWQALEGCAGRFARNLVLAEADARALEAELRGL